MINYLYQLLKSKVMNLSKKIPILTLATILLSGCSLTSIQVPLIVPASTPTSQAPTLKPTSTLPTKSSKRTESQTFNVTGNYISPDGPESINVKLTLSDGLVQDVVVTPNTQDKSSLRWQQAFASGIKEVVVGKNIANLSVDKVSGSSLTGKGFNDALDKIRAKM